MWFSRPESMKVIVVGAENCIPSVRFARFLVAEMISKRTKAAKARGVKLGGDGGKLNSKHRSKGTAASIVARNAKADNRARDLAPILWELAGLSYCQDARSGQQRPIARGNEAQWPRRYHVTHQVIGTLSRL